MSNAHRQIYKIGVGPKQAVMHIRIYKKSKKSLGTEDLHKSSRVRTKQQSSLDMDTKHRLPVHLNCAFYNQLANNRVLFS